MIIIGLASPNKSQVPCELAIRYDYTDVTPQKKKFAKCLEHTVKVRNRMLNTLLSVN